MFAETQMKVARGDLFFGLGSEPDGGVGLFRRTRRSFVSPNDDVLSPADSELMRVIPGFSPALRPAISHRIQ